MLENAPTGMRNLKSHKLYLRVYDEIRSYIINSQLRPGDKLPTEMEMCESLGVSRNVLREAIKALEITGVVSSKPGVGIVIQEFNPDTLFKTLFYGLAIDSDSTLDQTLAVRRVLELGFSSEAFHTLKQEDIVALRKRVETMERVAAKNSCKQGYGVNWAEFSKSDAEFHMILYKNTGNAFLQAIIRAVWNCDSYYLRTFPPQYIEQTIEKHQRILSTLEAQDEKAFYKAMYDHFDVEYKSFQ